MQWLGDTMKVFFHHDEIELGSGDIIVSSFNLSESELPIERPTIRVLFLDLKAEPLYMGEGVTGLDHHPLANALALKPWQDVHARDEQNLTL
jgi:hypothetical protein